MINKKAESTGDAVFNMYRVLLVSFIALVILGVAGIVYSYNIDVRDSEAMIFARDIVNCVAPSGVLDLNVFNNYSKKDIFSVCGYGNSEKKRFFISISVYMSNMEVSNLTAGDEPLAMVQKLYGSDSDTKDIEEYRPGYYDKRFPANILKNGAEMYGEIKVEVVTRDEV